MKIGPVTVVRSADIAALSKQITDLRTYMMSQFQILQKGETQIMAGVSDVNSAETTLHQDLVSEDGLIKQILVAVANGNLSSTAAQALVDTMTADDATAKSNIAAITAALPAPATTA